VDCESTVDRADSARQEPLPRVLAISLTKGEYHHHALGEHAAGATPDVLEVAGLHVRANCREGEPIVLRQLGNRIVILPNCHSRIEK
jgi:hypothetical protein